MNTHISRELKRYNHLVTEIDRAYHEITLRLGLSDSAMIVLYTICENGESCLLEEIRRCSGLPKQTINSALRRLEAEGILYLEMAGSKNKNVVLTDAGKRLAERTALRIMQAEDAVFASWPAEDVEKYLELTERYLTAFREHTRQKKETEP